MISAVVYGVIGAIGIFGIFGIFDLHNALGAFLVIGPVEEAAKLLAMFSCLPLFRRHMNEPADGVIYMACVALGFSLIENYFYAMSAEQVGGMLFMRLLTATPAHILFSFPMGLALYARRHEGARKGLVRRAFIYAALTHGLWDALAFNGLSLVVFVLLLWLGGRFFGAVMSYAASVSPFREALEDFLSGPPDSESEKGLKCIHCGDVSPKPMWRRGRVHVQHCGGCGRYVTSWDGLFFLIRHFGGWYGRLDVTPLPDGAEVGTHTVQGGNIVSQPEQLAVFDLSELTPVLDELGERGVTRVEKAWWFPGRLS